MIKSGFVLLTILGISLAGPVWAAETGSELDERFSSCEVLTMRYIPDEAGQGGMDLTTYAPAQDYINSVYDDDAGHISTIRGDRIRALLCERDDVLPVDADYPLLTTGVPFILSQDFDDTETDSLTIFWRKTYFDYVYKGHPLSLETETLLKSRLEAYSNRDHGLNNDKVKTPEILSTNVAPQKPN